jgi:hypothetical protein
MKKNGIHFTNEGTAVLAHVNKSRSARTYRFKIDIYESLSIFKKLKLLYSPNFLTIATYWKRDTSLITIDNWQERNLPSGYTVCISDMELSIMRELGGPAIDGVVPADIFLQTVPKEFINTIPNDYITVYTARDFYLLGVVIEGKLGVTFRGSLAAPEKIVHILERLKRYWKLQDYKGREIRSVVVLNETIPENLDSTEWEIFHAPVVKSGEYQLQSLQALGAALYGFQKDHISFIEPTPHAEMRPLRLTFLFTISSLILTFLLLWAAGFLLERRMTSENEDMHEQLIEYLSRPDNPEESIASLRKLAEKVIDYNAIYANTDNWGNFLEVLAKVNDSRIMLEKVGSNPGVGNQTEIALAGTCPAAEPIDSLARRLKAYPFLTNVTIAALENTGVSGKEFYFKIVCILKRH